MKNKIYKSEPPLLLIKFSNYFLSLTIIYILFIIIYAIYRINFPIFSINLTDTSTIKFYYFVIFALFFLEILFLYVFFTNNKIKVNVSLAIFSISLTLLILEFFLQINSMNKFKFDYNPIDDFKHEARTKFDIIKDLKENDYEVYPSYLPSLIYTDDYIVNNKIIFPLSGISNAITVYSNESGFFPIIKTDEYGFNNPPNLYNKKQIDIMIIGDSFVEGCCVNQNQTIAAHLRKLGYNAISLGKFDTGSLAQFAILKEYARIFQPKNVVWMFYINDLNDIRRESQSEILTRYLNEENFNQNLVSRQPEIDEFLKPFINDKIKDYNIQQINQQQKNFSRVEVNEKWFLKIIKFYNIRSKILGFIPKPDSISELEKILNKSKKLISDWDGKLYFINVPSLETVYKGHQESVIKKVLKIVNKLDIDTIKTYDVIVNHENPLIFFPKFDTKTGKDLSGSRAIKNLHYNSRGYNLIANLIHNKIKENN